MGPSVLQVGLFASLLILVSCASITPRSPQPEARRGFGAGGGGGGGGVGGGGAGGGWGFGGGFGGGGSRPGGEEDADGDDSGEDGGEDGGDGGGDGDGEGGDDGGSSGGDDCDYDEEEGDGGEQARSTRSGGMKITEVIEDLKSAPKSNDKLRLLPAISLDKLLSLELDLQAGR